MKKILSSCFALLIAANSLIAWYSYYPSVYGYGGFEYPGYSYDDGYQQYGGYAPKQTVPQQTTTPPATPQQTPQDNRPLEQQHAKLIVMFTKNQCPYCQYMKPIMNAVEAEHGQNVKFIYVDIEQNPQSASQYGFSTVPHIVYFKDGKQLESHGSDDKQMTKERVEEKIEKYFGAK